MTLSFNDEEQVEIRFKITKMDLKATFNTNYFTLAKNMEAATITDIEIPVMDIDSVVYPMYIPEKTSLNAQDVVSTDKGDRIILTFAGDKPFVLVEEAVSKEKELTTIPMSGDPILLTSTIGALSPNSISWVSDGIEYYLASEVLKNDELVSISESIRALPVMK